MNAVTPFEQWYATNIAATLPKDFPPELAAQAKKSLAACWNEALDAVLREAGYERVQSGGITVGIYRVGEPQMDALRVTP